MFSVFYKSYDGESDRLANTWYLSKDSAAYAAIEFLRMRDDYKYAVILGPDHTDIKVIESTYKR